MCIFRRKIVLVVVVVVGDERMKGAEIKSGCAIGDAGKDYFCCGEEAEWEWEFLILQKAA